MELKLSRIKRKDGAIGASSLATVNGESNGIVECEAESRMCLLTALAAVKEVRLDKINGREQS
jgi:RNase P/RNase MRP subunit POP5